MKYFKYSIIAITVLMICSTVLTSVSCAEKFPHPNTYIPTLEKIIRNKEFFDDPRPYVKTFGVKQIAPKKMWDYLSADKEKAAALWAEVVGFKAPDVVGKISPEIKPGKYTWKDVQNNPAFKKLFPETLLGLIREAGPPLAGAIPEFEIIPTNQYYHHLPVGEATKKNMGKTKLDENGYIMPETYDSGIPFPRPSGKFKGQQCLYNRVYTYVSQGMNFWSQSKVIGFDKNIRVDAEMDYQIKMQRMAGRVLFEPKGWLSDRSKKRMESSGYQFIYSSPRDVAGMVMQSMLFQEPSKFNQDLLYIPTMRRIRKLSATDTQDPMPGLSTTYDDVGIFNQKMTPNRYPMSVKVIEEREYLMIAPEADGSMYYRKSDGARMNTKLERRPIYLVEIVELDDNYIYSKRTVYFDQEHTMALFGDYYDQKGRKWRSQTTGWAFNPEMGGMNGYGADYLYADHVDLHSEVDRLFVDLPADWPADEISLRNVMKRAK